MRHTHTDGLTLARVTNQVDGFVAIVVNFNAHTTRIQPDNNKKKKLKIKRQMNERMFRMAVSYISMTDKCLAQYLICI